MLLDESRAEPAGVPGRAAQNCRCLIAVVLLGFPLILIDMFRRKRHSLNRLVGSSSVGSQTGRDLLLAEGLPRPAGVKLRSARPGESDEANQLLRLAGVEFHPGVARAIETRVISSALLRALEPGHRTELLDDLAAVAGAGSDEAMRALAGMDAVLVAEDAAGELVGAIWAGPPFKRFLEIEEAGVSFVQARWAGPAAVVKLRSLGVDENARGAGIGMALVTHCTQLYFELGYRLAFGQIRSGFGLETYYPKLGFEVLPEEKPIRIDGLLGLPFSEVGINAKPQERLIARWRTTQEPSLSELLLLRLFAAVADAGVAGGLERAISPRELLGR